MGQYNFYKTGEITDIAGEIIGNVTAGGDLSLKDESIRSDVLRDLQFQVTNDNSFEWTDDLLFAANMPVKERSGEIRLACIHCDTDEADWINEFPEGWEILDGVQSLEESMTVSHPDSSQSPWDWYTHLGVCPCCKKREQS